MLDILYSSSRFLFKLCSFSTTIFNCSSTGLAKQQQQQVESVLHRRRLTLFRHLLDLLNDLALLLQAAELRSPLPVGIPRRHRVVAAAVVLLRVGGLSTAAATTDRSCLPAFIYCFNELMIYLSEPLLAD